MTHLEYKLRAMGVQDIGDLIQITDAVEWGFPENYWKTLLATGRVLGLYTQDGALAATSAIFDYGESLSFLGVVIVRGEYRGKGLATRIVDAAEEGMIGQGKPIILIASDAGKPVYEHRGYVVTGDCTKFLRPAGAPQTQYPSLPGYRIKPLQPTDIEAVKSYDVQAFGADRGHVLSVMLAADMHSVALIDEKNGRLVGYALTAQRNDTIVIGPVMADKDTQAAAMVQILTYGRREQFRLDVLSRQVAFKDAMLSLSFKIDETSPVMQLGDGGSYMDNACAFGMISQALG